MSKASEGGGGKVYLLVDEYSTTSNALALNGRDYSVITKRLLKKAIQ